MKKLNKRFPNKRAFITGAGSGLGAAFTEILVKNDWTLFLADIDGDALQKYQDVPKVYRYVLDISDRQGFSKVSKEVGAITSNIDLLINNAGIGDGELFGNYKVQNWEKMVQVNLMGVYYGCHFMMPMLKHQNDALIINIGSAAGFMNAPGMSAYNATKAAVYSLSETLLHELEHEGIQVSVAAPTFFQTNIMEQADGSQQFVDFAKKQMKYSKTNATETAEVILTEAANGIFCIIHPKVARRNYWLKKWFPWLVKKQFRRMMARFSG